MGVQPSPSWAALSEEELSWVAYKIYNIVYVNN